MNKQSAPSLTFIERARRAQIVAATIETLADIGFGRTSFAQIAKRAKISASLIPYHFASKDELVERTLEEIATGWDRSIEQHVAKADTSSQRLEQYIRASLMYMGTRPSQFAALIEIVFNARTPEGKLLYRTVEEEPGQTLLVNILKQGQREGEFRPFEPHRMALAIRGAINEFFGTLPNPEAEVEAYATALVDLFRVAVVR